MDSDDELYDDDLYDDCTDSGNESPFQDDSADDDEFGMDPGFDEEQPGGSSQKIEDEYYFEVRTLINLFIG